MTRSQLHHLSATIPQGLTAADLPGLVADWFGIAGLDPEAIRQPKGRHGYSSLYALRDSDGAELVAVLLNGTGTLRGTSHVTMHGRAWEVGDLDPVHICSQIMARCGWATEVHLALDDTAGLLPWDQIKGVSTCPGWANDITSTTCRPRLNRRTGTREGDPVLLTGAGGATVYFGTREADTSVAFYDRRGPLRVEYRTRTRGGATDITRRISEGEDIGLIASGVIARCLRFHASGTGRKDRRPVAEWWTQFLSGAEPIQLPRHRSPRHRSPWYVPPTKAERVGRSIARTRSNGRIDPATLDLLRSYVAEEESLQDIDEKWNETKNGNQSCNYLSPNSTLLEKQKVSLPVAEFQLPVAEFHNFAPDITF